MVKLQDCYVPTSVHSLYVADELGFFREEGIKPEFVGVIPPAQLVAAVMAGKVDVGGAHANRTIAGINAGAKIKAVAGNTETTKDKPHMIYLTLENSPLKAPRTFWASDWPSWPLVVAMNTPPMSICAKKA